MSKKIIVFGSFALSLVKFRFQLLKDLTNNGYEVFACAPDADDQIIDKLISINVKYVHIDLCRTGINPFRDVINLLRMKNTFLDIKPDFILCYTIKPVIYGSIAAKLAGIKNIYSIVTGLGYSFVAKGIKANIVNFIVSSLLKISLKYNRTIFFQNPDDIDLFQEKKLLKNSEQSFLINGSGVDLEHYQKASLPIECSFLLIARLIKDKGVVEYAKAAKLVKKSHPNTKFYLAGWIDTNPSSITQSELDEWISSGTIDFLGELDDVREAFTMSSVYVLPSYREGTPRTVLEAMAMGRAIITTDAPGCRETVIDGENGYLVPIKNSVILADKMEYLINTPKVVQKMADSSYKIVNDKYDVHKVNDIILQEMELI
ncbi:MAG: glycosyltransferase family 4 protein [Emcibacteraceae bacterium]|nr:glycosyltransferase family 4 protein [Emcibacteraceae bacterium]MDG1857945.1 glycosyltransferase family 4 protein [Emcibacteraceae bacterium]